VQVKLIAREVESLINNNCGNIYGAGYGNTIWLYLCHSLVRQQKGQQVIQGYFVMVLNMFIKTNVFAEMGIERTSE
jgi:hypothetical protein